MILPKEFFDKIEYFEHSMKTGYGTDMFDVFTIHFKSWYRRSRVIKIQRTVENYDAKTETFTHRVTPGAADLYNQLNNWATSTFEEKLSHITKKYIKHEMHDNVVVLKSKPKDINNE